ERDACGAREEAVFGVIRGDRIRIGVRRSCCDESTGQQPEADLQQLDFRIHGEFLRVTGRCSMNKLTGYLRADSLVLVTHSEEYYRITPGGPREVPYGL